MDSILESMYGLEPDVLNSDQIEKLFPSEGQGCINFGYWENIIPPLDIPKRVTSQRNLYGKIFEKIDANATKILEIGCGRGHGVYWLTERGYEVHGIDFLESQIIKSKENYPQLSSSFNVGMAEEIPFASLNFDCIFSLEAAQHFASFDQFCAESSRILKEDGRLIISTYFFTDRKYIKEIEQIIPTNIEGFHNAISISEALNFLKKNGFDVIQHSSLGKHVFPQYAHWQKMQLGDTPLSALSEERVRWKDYYTGGGVNEHPWNRAYKNRWVDYFLIVATKSNEIV